MILSPHEWENLIKQAPIYLIRSNELLLLTEVRDHLKTRLTQQGSWVTERFTVDANFNWQALSRQAQSLSLFATQHWLEVTLPTGKINEHGSKLLQTYCENPFPDTSLVLLMEKIEKSVEKTPWFKAINKIGYVVTLWPPTLQELPHWINQRAKKKNMLWDKEACLYLAEHTEGNLLATAQAMEKIQLLNGEGKIDKTTVLNHIHQQSHFTVFELIDSALKQERERVCLILQVLKETGMAPTLILWALTREIRSLARMAWHLTQGVSLNQAIQQENIWQQRQGFIRQTLQRHSIHTFHRLLALAHVTDGLIKGLTFDINYLNPWQALSQIILGLT